MRWKWPRAALAAAAVLTMLALTGLTPLPAKADPFTFTGSWGNLNALKCLGVLNGDMTPGTAAVQWTCDNSSNQSWILQTPGGLTNSFVTTMENSADPSKCLGVLGGATTDGSNLVIWGCNGSPDQAWWFQQVTAPNVTFPFGCYSIVNVKANPKVLGILGANPSNFGQAVIWDPIPGHPDQVWCPGPNL
jgi:hypothetical protein